MKRIKRRISLVLVRDAYRIYYGERFGNLNQLTEMYGYELYDHLENGGTLDNFGKKRRKRAK